MTDTKAILVGARQLIAERGLAVAAFHDTTKDCYCALGALCKAATPAGDIVDWHFPEDISESDSDLYEAMAAVARAAELARYDDIARWSDGHAAGGTTDVVLAAFDKAIESLEDN